MMHMKPGCWICGALTIDGYRRYINGEPANQARYCHNGVWRGSEPECLCWRCLRAAYEHKEIRKIWGDVVEGADLDGLLEECAPCITRSQT